MTLSPAAGSLAAGQVGTAYNQSVSASGGTAPYSYAVTAGAVPAGITLNTATGALSGTPTSTGTANFTITATDANSATGAAAYSVQINAAPVTIAFSPSAGALTAGEIGTPYNQNISASGGMAPYTYAVTNGTLPQGMSLDTTAGALSGTPTGAAGTSSFTITATDANSATGSAAYTLLINAAPLSNIATLTSLSVSQGTLSPAFASGTSSYTVSVANAVNSITVTPTVTDADATVTVNQTGVTSGTASGTIALNVGSNTINVVVTAQNGTTTQTYTVTVTRAAPLALTPSAGTLAAAQVGAPYSQSISASGGTAPYTYSLTAGAFPAGITLDTTTGILSGTPTAGGSTSFTITSTDASGETGAAAYSLTVAAPTISISPTTLPAGTVGASYAAQTLAVTGGTAPYSFVFSGILPPGMTFDTTTGEIAGTPNTQSNYSFTVEVTDSSTGTGPYSFQTSLNISIAQPTVVLTPADGTTLTAGLVGAAYSDTSISATGGSGDLEFSADNPADLPDGLSIATATGAITGTPTQAGTFVFTIWAAGTMGGASSAEYTIVVANAAPTITVAASDSAPALGASVTFTATLAGGSSPSGTVTFKDGTTTLGTGTISGTTATYSTAALAVGARSITAEYAGDGNNAAATSNAITVTVGPLTPMITVAASDSAPALGASVTFTATLAGGSSPSGTVTFKDGTTTLGTGTISGTTATYSTAALAVGAHSITAEYAGDGNNAAATSAAITVTVAAPVFSFNPAAGALSPGEVNTAYSQAVSAAASGSTQPVTYTLGSGALPAGLSLDAGSGVISGVPSQSGSYTFTIVATDSSTPANSGEASYTLAISPAVVMTFTPASGSLPQAMAGEDYNQTISATGGSGALTYSIVSGALPDGMVINASTGELTGPVDLSAEVKDYTFTVEARDGGGFTATAIYTLTVLERAVTVTNKQVQVPAGSAPNNVDLTRGATGGPFVSADIVTVNPPNAGTVSIVRGEFAQAGTTGPLGWYLKFVPNPSYAGQVTVQFRLTSALGISNAGIVTYALSYDPGEVAAEIDGLVHGFVRSRQNLIASTLEVPGLLQRRQAAQGSDPVTMRMSPSSNGIRANVATSLIQIEAAANNADGIDMAELSPFNIWLDATFMAHNRDDNEGRWGSFAMISAGVDYLVSDRFLAGLSFHYDHMSDPTQDDAELMGDGWLIGPYASFEIGKGVFWDTSLLYGGSANDVDTAFWDGSFDTRRWAFDTSLKGQWQIDDATVLTPKLRAFYFSETVNDYGVTNGNGDLLEIRGFTEEQLRVSLGAEIARSFSLESGSVLTPKLGVTAGFSGLDGSGAFGQVSAGLSMDTIDAWKLDLGLLFNIEGEGEQALGARAGMSKRF